jgi:enamine deaminase RidA (YjgF/YER057c/UK114 family)
MASLLTESAGLGTAFEGIRLSAAEEDEVRALGLLSAPPRPAVPASVARRPVRAPQVLNEAYQYPTPVSFSRGLRVDLGTHALILISGTASIDEHGRTVHAGDFRAQCWRTYRNITRLLESEAATWRDVVRCTCYLRDIERDYREFNRVRTAFFAWLALDPLPASVGVQARLCREDLLVEIEAMAVVKSPSCAAP